MAEIHQIFVFEVAHSIDLDQAERILGGATARQAFRHRGRAAQFLRFDPAPLRISQERPPLTIHRWATEATVDLVLYDFGVVTVAYQIPVADDLQAMRAASAALRGDERLRLDAQGLAESLPTSLAPAVVRPSHPGFNEDYTIFGLRQIPGGGTSAEFCERHAGEIAAILRPDAGELSEPEIRDATDARISFGPSDVTIVDWEAAFVLDPAPEDVRAVLEFANVQLLEMRWLDVELDQAIDRSYALLSRRRGWRAHLPRFRSADVSAVAELQLEGAVMRERVSNAIKVFGEEYLTRIYRLAAGRLQLAALDATISHKLATVESIYQKMSDRAATARLEALEWIVIILIASEIVLSLLR